MASICLGLNLLIQYQEMDVMIDENAVEKIVQELRSASQFARWSKSSHINSLTPGRYGSHFESIIFELLK